MGLNSKRYISYLEVHVVNINRLKKATRAQEEHMRTAYKKYVNETLTKIWRNIGGKPVSATGLDQAYAEAGMEVLGQVGVYDQFTSVDANFTKDEPPCQSNPSSVADNACTASAKVSVTSSPQRIRTKSRSVRIVLAKDT